MSLQYSVAVNNARLDAVETAIGTAPSLVIYSGSVPANCAAADPAGVLCTIVLPSDWMAAAASGVKSLAGSWAGNASGAGTAASFRIKQGATCHVQGTVGMGSGDLQLNNTNLASGQAVSVSSFTLTAGNV